MCPFPSAPRAARRSGSRALGGGQSWSDVGALHPGRASPTFPLGVSFFRCHSHGMFNPQPRYLIFLGHRSVGDSREGRDLSPERCLRPRTHKNLNLVSGDVGHPRAHPWTRGGTAALRHGVGAKARRGSGPLKFILPSRNNPTVSVLPLASQIANRLHYFQMEIFLRQEINIFSRPPHGTCSE